MLLCEEKYPLKLAKAYTDDIIAEFQQVNVYIWDSFFRN